MLRNQRLSAGRRVGPHHRTHQKHYCYGHPFTRRRDYRRTSKWTAQQSLCPRTRSEEKHFETYDICGMNLVHGITKQWAKSHRRPSCKTLFLNFPSCSPYPSLFEAYQKKHYFELYLFKSSSTYIRKRKMEEKNRGAFALTCFVL